MNQDLLLIGISPAIVDIRKKIEIASKGNAPVLILGETGTGKELVAKSIHIHQQTRKNTPFVSVNCAAIQDTLLESELFGHVKGSFTGAFKDKKGKFESANGGILFLDEISNMSKAIQAKILRAIEYQCFERVGGLDQINVDVKIITATNVNLMSLIKENEFRNDLYYRISVLVITIPPLRERREDIPVLANHFLNIFNKKYDKESLKLTNDALSLLSTYKLPGNVRELRNIIERSVLFCDDSYIGPDQLVVNNLVYLNKETNLVDSIVEVLEDMNFNGGMPEALESIEKSWILRELLRSDDVQNIASEALGISPRVLCYKMKKFGIRNTENAHLLKVSGPKCKHKGVVV